MPHFSFRSCLTMVTGSESGTKCPLNATFHFIGGLSRNELLNRLTANAVGIPVIAGASEATAIGNVMVQALAAGAARDIASMRQLINRSIPLKTFYPQDMEDWNAAYLHFKQLTMTNYNG